MNKREQFSQAPSLKGVYRITKAKLETPEQWQLHEKIKEHMNNGLAYMHLVHELNSISQKEVFDVENIIPIGGRAVLADNLTSASPNNDPRINYTALGTDSTSPTNSNTALGTESYRKQTASSTNSDNVAYVTAFYTADEVNGTFNEHGLFCDGTASTDSGALFSRVLLNSGSGISKTNTETLTIDYTITIS